MSLVILSVTGRKHIEGRYHYIFLWIFYLVLGWLLVPCLSFFLRTYLVSLLALWPYGYLNDRFGQVGDVEIMCPATIFKLPGIVKYSEYLIMELYMYLYMELLYMFSMELSLVGTYLSCMLKEAGQLSVEYNILFILERLPGYTDDWKELDRIVRLQP